MENDIILKNLIFMRNYYENIDDSKFNIFTIRIATYISQRYGLKLYYYDVRQFLQQNSTCC